MKGAPHAAAPGGTPGAGAGPGHTWEKRDAVDDTNEAKAPDATVLLVEDNADNQEIYRIILAHHGYAVLQAWDGEVGVRMARHHRPAVILMDLTMPNVDGLEATRRLKADPATAAIPVIALTADAEKGVRTAAAAAGCVSFLSKPAAPRQVAEEVGRVLALRAGARAPARTP